MTLFFKVDSIFGIQKYKKCGLFLIYEHIDSVYRIKIKFVIWVEGVSWTKIKTKSAIKYLPHSLFF
jgi:hypothetical protein